MAANRDAAGIDVLEFQLMSPKNLKLLDGRFTDLRKH